MRTKDLILHYIKRCFNGCYLPSNDFITDRIKADMGCEVEVVELAENSLKLKLIVEDDGLVIDFTKEVGANGLQNWCTNIDFVE